MGLIKMISEEINRCYGVVPAVLCESGTTLLTAAFSGSLNLDVVAVSADGRCPQSHVRWMSPMLI